MEPLAPGMRRIGGILRRQKLSSVSRLTDEEILKSQSTTVPETFASMLMGTKPAGVRSEDRVVDGIPIRVYRPSRGPRPSTGSGTGSSTRPLVLYFHGGGFVFGELRGGDWICGTVARDLDAVVVSVDYRLAPTHPFPAAVDDCFAVTEWAAANAAELGADAGRLGVMGESAGANLAAVVCLVAQEKGGPNIRHQALLYPVVGAGETDSRRANADALILTLADMKRFDELYGGDPADWRKSPIRAKSLKGLPPALIEVAAHDPLHDDGVLYADALRGAGVEVELIDYPAMPHGFMNFPRWARDAKPGMAAMVAAQKKALAP
jgi:acetyl esterase